jgi:uncharacterized protein
LDTLPRYCQACEVLTCHGGCPKDRILHTPDGETKLNYLCAAINAFHPLPTFRRRAIRPMAPAVP